MFLWIILLCGVAGMCDCVIYQLSADPRRTLKIGQTELTITVKLNNASKAGTDMQLKVSAMTDSTAFRYSPSEDKCEFGTFKMLYYTDTSGVYQRTGTIVQCDPSNNQYVVRFSPVTAANFGRCNIYAEEEDPSHSYSAYPWAQVYVWPSVRISQSSSYHAVREGEEVRMTCTVDNDIPLPVTLTWRRISYSDYTTGNNTESVLPAANTSRIQYTTSDRSCVLTFISVSWEDAGYYECTASSVQGSQPSMWSRLNVYHAANVTLTVDTDTVTAGSTVTLTCASTFGWPNPGLVIYDVATNTSLAEKSVVGSTHPRRQATLTFAKMMQKSDNASHYRCRTDVTDSQYLDFSGVQSNVVTIGVPFPPDSIKVPDTVTVDEGQNVTVRCEISSSNPQAELTWSGSGSDQAVQSTSLVNHGGIKTVLDLTITGDRTRNGELITCAATYLGKQILTASTKINVNFAPQKIGFYDTPDTPVIENQERVMRCRTETSKPAGTIVWRKTLNGVESVVQAGSVSKVTGDFGGTVLEAEVTIEPTRKDNGAKHGCEVKYTYTNGTKVSKKSVMKALEVYFSVDVSVSIMRGESAALTCVTRGGNPQTIDQYSWSYNDEVVSGASDRTLNVRYDQGGNYSCSATNKAGRSRSDPVDVRFEPGLNPTAANQLELGAAVGESVTFVVSIIAIPPPSDVEWRNNRTSSPLGPRFHAERDQNVLTLKVSNIAPEDFATYACKVTNSAGSLTFFVTLKPTGPPDKPSNFAAAARTNSTLTLEWKSEFSGARSQTFLLELLTTDSRVFEVGDPGSGSVVTQVVNNLQAGIEYRFRLRAQNDLGLFSPYTDTVTSTTKLNMNDLKVTVELLDETTAVIGWWARGELLEDYADATVTIQYTLSDHDSRALSDTTDSTTAKFSHRNTPISVMTGFTYIFHMTVYDNGHVVCQRYVNLSSGTLEEVEAEVPIMILAGALAGLALCVVICVAINTVLCVYISKLKRRNSKSKTPQNVDSTGGLRNTAFQEDPHASPNDPKSPYFNYRGNKYAVAGEPDDDVRNNTRHGDYDVTQYDYAEIPAHVDRAVRDSDMEDEAGYLAPRRGLPRPPAISDIDVTDNEAGYLAPRSGLPRFPAISDIDVTNDQYDGTEAEEDSALDEAGYMDMSQNNQKNVSDGHIEEESGYTDMK